MTPHPSPRTYPSAAASNVLQRARGDSMLARERTTLVSVFRMSCTPPASAASARPLRIASQAWCTATREDEHAVSILMLGPRRSNKYDKRFAAILSALPVPKYASSRAASCSSSRYSMLLIPTNTPTFLPASASGDVAPSSSACQATSSSSR